MTTRTVPKNGFTVTWLDNLKSEPKRFEIPDRGAKGLRLRVSPGGAKTFVWLYRDGKTTRRVTIGQYGDRDGQITLAKARKKVVELKDNLRAGIKPHASGEGTPKTVTELFEAFYKRRILNIRKRPDIIRQVLDHDIIPIIGNRRLSTITTTTLVGVVDKVVDRGAKAHAGRVLSTIKQAFKWAQVRGYVELSPASPLDASQLKSDLMSIEAAAPSLSIAAQMIVRELPSLAYAVKPAMPHGARRATSLSRLLRDELAQESREPL
jgi:hypothetical protein